MSDLYARLAWWRIRRLGAARARWINRLERDDQRRLKRRPM